MVQRIPDGPPMIAGTILDGLIRVFPARGHVRRNPARPALTAPHRLAGTSGHYRHVRHVHWAWK